ncbi:hypothetical protein ACVW0Y_003684 [Pseudomonas sp. TE3786]
MDTPFIKSSVLLKSISWSAASGEIIYVFSVNGVERRFAGEVRGSSKIRAIGYSDELDNFMMSLMPRDGAVSKRLIAISWDYIEGRDIQLPVTLIL